jgi:hypothetical protein
MRTRIGGPLIALYDLLIMSILQPSYKHNNQIPTSRSHNIPTRNWRSPIYPLPTNGRLVLQSRDLQNLSDICNDKTPIFFPVLRDAFLLRGIHKFVLAGQELGVSTV